MNSDPVFVTEISLSVILFFICNSCGGVEMIAQGGKIKLDNTLDSRLALISHQVKK